MCRSVLIDSGDKGFSQTLTLDITSWMHYRMLFIQHMDKIYTVNDLFFSVLKVIMSGCHSGVLGVDVVLAVEEEHRAELESVLLNHVNYRHSKNKLVLRIVQSVLGVS